MDSELDDSPEKELSQEGEQADDGALRNEDSHEEGEQDSNTEQVRVKAAQAKMHEATRKAAETERKLAELQGKLDAVLQMQSGNQQNKEEANNPFDFLDDQAFVESLYDDPKNAVKALKNIIGVFGDTLRTQEEVFNQRLQERVGSIDPEVRALKGRISELKKNPKLAVLPDEYLAEIAKLQPATKDQEDDGFRGSLPSGSRRVASKEEDKQREAGVAFFMKKLGYDRLDEKE